MKQERKNAEQPCLLACNQVHTSHNDAESTPAPKAPHKWKNPVPSVQIIREKGGGKKEAGQADEKTKETTGGPQQPHPKRCRSSTRCSASPTPSWSCATLSGAAARPGCCRPAFLARPLGRIARTGIVAGAGRRRAHPASEEGFPRAPGRRKAPGALGRAVRCFPAATARGRFRPVLREGAWEFRVGRRSQ